MLSTGSMAPLQAARRALATSSSPIASTTEFNLSCQDQNTGQILELSKGIDRNIYCTLASRFTIYGRRETLRILLQ